MPLKKPVPVIVTVVPPYAVPLFGLMLPTVLVTNVKFSVPEVPATVTVELVNALWPGVTKVRCVEFTYVAVVFMWDPLKSIRMLAPFNTDVNPDPVIVIVVPPMQGPLVGERLDIVPVISDGSVYDYR
jgi:hypothetical protein